MRSRYTCKTIFVAVGNDKFTMAVMMMITITSVELRSQGIRISVRELITLNESLRDFT